MNQMEKVAKQFPNTVFMHATGYKQGKNLGIYDVRTYEGAYMLGVVAGQTTKTNTLGVVAHSRSRKWFVILMPIPWVHKASILKSKPK